MATRAGRVAEQARGRGLRAIIAGAGGAAHLPGMIAAKTIVPVLGVPVPSKYLRGEDSLLSIVPLLILTVITLSHFVDREELLQTLGRYLEWLLPGQSAAIVGDESSGRSSRR